MREGRRGTKGSRGQNGSACARLVLGAGLLGALLWMGAELPGELKAARSGELEALLEEYEAYQQRFDDIEYSQDLGSYGYNAIEGQIFPVVLESFGEEAVTVIPAMETSCRRMALFIADSQGKVLYKTNQLETNNRKLGALEQPNRGVSAISFQDANGDGLTDIVLITLCENREGEYAGKPYKVGDVLFQGERSFYRDWRISDKINRFSMNKSARMILSYVKNGQSAEVLYNATTKRELEDSGFTVFSEQNYTWNFEKLGRLEVVPGVLQIGEFDIFMIYLVNEQGSIVWSFQPMGEYDNLYSLRGTARQDLDGDGLTDLAVLAKYSYADEAGNMQVVDNLAIYYQRTGGFDVDTEFMKQYTIQPGDNMKLLVERVRQYWGWTND